MKYVHSSYIFGIVEGGLYCNGFILHTATFTVNKQASALKSEL